MIKTVTYINKHGYPQSIVMDILEEEKKFIYGKRVHDDKPFLIERKDIKSITEAVVEKIKS